jgi:hypothetical protein
LEIVLIYTGELSRSEGGELVSKEIVHIRYGGQIHRCEYCALVRDVAEYDGDLDEAAFLEHAVSVVGDEVAVNNRCIEIERRLLGAWERCCDVLALKCVDIQITKAGEGVFCSVTAGAVNQIVICKLRFINGVH